jgi:hypothetical protein
VTLLLLLLLLGLEWSLQQGVASLQIKKSNFTLQTKSIVQKFQLQILELKNES